MLPTAETVIWQTHPLAPQAPQAPQNPPVPGTLSKSAPDSPPKPEAQPKPPASSTRIKGQVPFNPRYNDIYRSSGTNGLGGLDQARHVFLSGCGLVGDGALWRDQSQWRILETGLGLGLNFLATWLAWSKDPHAPQMLHYVSVEAHPVKPQDVWLSVQDWPELHALAQEFIQAYWGLLPGFHKLILGGGRVHLSVIVADVQDALKSLVGVFDSVYLDGFSPLKNPQMWSPLTLKGVAAHCRIGTQVATWSVAKGVKEGLKSAGFKVEITPGLSPKREQLRATYEPHWLTPRPSLAPGPSDPRVLASSNTSAELERSCVVIGAGLAGASVARSMAMRGWRVRVIDARQPRNTAAPSGLGWDDQARPLSDGAQGLPMAMFHPMFTGDENVQSRLIRAGIRVLLGYLHLLDPDSTRGLHQVTGVLEYKKPSKSSLDPSALAQLSAQRLSAPFYADWTLDGEPLEPDAAALWHRPAGWVKPQALIESLLEHPNIECLSSQTVRQIAANEGNAKAERWRVLLAGAHEQSTSTEIRCATLIVAAGPGTQSLLSALIGPTDTENAARTLELQEIAQTWPLQVIKGQITMGSMVDLERSNCPIETQGLAAAKNLPHVTNLPHSTNLPHVTNLPYTANLPHVTNLPHSTNLPHLPHLPHLPLPMTGLPTYPVHGSISWTPNIDLQSHKGSLFFIGSTFEREQPHIQNSAKSQMRNWAHLQSLFPGRVPVKVQDIELLDWSGVRSTCPDRVPLCGPMTTQGTTLDSPAPESGLYVMAALGSRGVALCTLMAEVLSAQINGEPQALPQRLLKAMDPRRFNLAT